jgi:hypothetical protein
MSAPALPALDRGGAVRARDAGSSARRSHTRTGPPLLVRKSGKLTAGSGLNPKQLGTIRRPNGKYQVTCAGLPLYTYLNDKRPGDVKGEGIEKIWSVGWTARRGERDGVRAGCSPLFAGRSSQATSTRK